jgi:hypothetical protein
MKIRLLSSAFDDLARGRDFYEQQGEGLGGYFLDSLFSDIDSLMLYAGIQRKVFGFHRLLSNGFRTRFITGWKRKTKWLFTGCWIAGKIRIKSALH